MKTMEMEVKAKKLSKTPSDVLDLNQDHLLIYRTNISSLKKVKLIQPFFDAHPHIVDWNVDRQDIDNVLRIEVSSKVNEKEILNYILNLGLLCEEL